MVGEMQQSLTLEDIINMLYGVYIKVSYDGQRKSISYNLAGIVIKKSRLTQNVPKPFVDLRMNTSGTFLGIFAMSKPEQRLRAEVGGGRAGFAAKSVSTCLRQKLLKTVWN